MKWIQTCLLASLLTTTSIGLVYAETANSGQNQQHSWGKDPAKRKEMMEQHMQKLHDALKLQSGQEAAWKTFISTMRSQGMRERQKPVEGATAPQRMEHMMQTQQQQMQQRLDGLKTFYAQLNPEQKKTMDSWHEKMASKMRGEKR
ncbi:Spy/CpxP family protein refolding chaperone [Neisseriaceae bacterium TC5R-5]|nr:Spy/CpxP family protein refolding chaperone [Neisseriaceae bacterium TC5R-5]